MKFSIFFIGCMIEDVFNLMLDFFNVSKGIVLMLKYVIQLIFTCN